MAIEEGRSVDLLDETRLNVASLLMEPVGNTRDVTVALAELVLADDLVARDIRAVAHLTHLMGGILVAASVAATVPLQCVTCLADFDEQISESFSEPFRQIVDVRSGAALPPGELDGVDDEDEPGFTIDESHELDLVEALRQWIVLAIPIKPSCGPNCPGPLLTSTEEEGAIDSRFASLGNLLNDDPD